MLRIHYHHDWMCIVRLISNITLHHVHVPMSSHSTLHIHCLNSFINIHYRRLLSKSYNMQVNKCHICSFQLKWNFIRFYGFFFSFAATVRSYRADVHFVCFFFLLSAFDWNCRCSRQRCNSQPSIAHSSFLFTFPIVNDRAIINTHNIRVSLAMTSTNNQTKSIQKYTRALGEQ